MVGCSPAHAEPPAARAWLVHPVTLFALVVFVANDHLLKVRFPGLVTGKLSDVAGLIVAPPILAVVVVAFVGPRRGRAVAFAAIVATGVGFTAVKAFPAIALIASGVWSAASGPSIILADRSDLAALPALGVAAWVSTRSGEPRLGESLHRIGILVVLPTAALAVAATSAPVYRSAVAAGVWRGMAVVGDTHFGDNKRPDTWRVSEDGAYSWRDLTADEADAWITGQSTVSLHAQAACAPAPTTYCYRVVSGHLRVEQSDDGGASWRVSWEVLDGQRDYLARTYDGLSDVQRDLSSQALAVVPTPGGYVVVVANGRNGYATRDVSGHWERVDFGRVVLNDGTVDSYPPSPLNADALHYLAPEFIAGLLAGLIAIGAGVLAATRRPRRPSVVVFAITLAVGALVALVALLNTVGLHFQAARLGLLSGGTAVIGAVIAVIGSFGALVTATTTGSLAARWAALISVIGAVVTITYGALYVRWSHETLGYRDASLIAVAVAIGGIALAVWLGRRRAR